MSPSVSTNLVSFIKQIFKYTKRPSALSYSSATFWQVVLICPLGGSIHLEVGIILLIYKTFSRRIDKENYLRIPQGYVHVNTQYSCRHSTIFPNVGLTGLSLLLHSGVFPGAVFNTAPPAPSFRNACDPAAGAGELPHLCCPKCHYQAPDMDTLQIHVMDCIQ